jgi:calcium-dependent protein kinase
VNDHYTFK